MSDAPVRRHDFSSLKAIEIPVKGPNGQWYLLREASADAVAKFNSKRAEGALIQDGEVVGVKGAGELEPLFVSYCLYHAEPVEENGTIVMDDDGLPKLRLKMFPNRDKTESPRLEKLDVIRSWSERIVRPLFDDAKEISEIDLDDDLPSLYKQRDKLNKQIEKLERDAAKNERSSSTIGSD